MPILLVPALLLCLASCQLTGPGDRAGLPDSLVVRGGTSYGECMGYCHTDLEIADGVAVLTQRGTSPLFPDRRLERSVPDSVAVALERHLDVEMFFTLDEVYGCPDCADGGAEWIEIVDRGRTRRVTFERHRPPDPVRDLARALDAYRQALVDGFG